MKGFKSHEKKSIIENSYPNAYGEILNVTQSKTNTISRSPNVIGNNYKATVNSPIVMTRNANVTCRNEEVTGQHINAMVINNNTIIYLMPQLKKPIWKD